MADRYGNMQERHVAVLGAGQAGTFAAGALADEGFSVRAADVKPDAGFFYRYGPKPEQASLELVDVRDPAGVRELVSRSPKIETVVLCVGRSGEESIKDPATARRLYKDGVVNVATAARGAGVQRFVLLSSLAVYGPANDKPLLSEDHSIAPPTAYGQLLFEAEQTARDAHGADMELIIIRSAGLFGPSRFGLGSHSARLFERLVYACALGDPVVVQGTLDDCDDYLYAKDLGRGLALATSARVGAPVSVFNLGTGKVSTLQEVVDAICSVFPASNIIVEPPSDGLGNRRTPMDVRRIRSAVGFEPRFVLADGIYDYASEAGLIQNGGHNRD